jgi:hypothetical protein
MKPEQGHTQHMQRRSAQAWQQQQQQQQLEVDRITPRRSAAIMSYRSAVVTIAVLIGSLCIVGVAASQQEQSVCSNQWDTHTLGTPQDYMVATSLPKQGLAFFAGSMYYFVIFSCLIFQCAVRYDKVGCGLEDMLR